MRSLNSPLDLASAPTLAAALCAVVASCLALPATATEPPITAAQEIAEVDAAETSNAGMRVAVDPKTGALRPITAKEAKALDDITKAKAAATARASAGGDSNSTSSAAAPGETFVDPSGAIGMVLDSSHMVYSVATVGEDGNVRMECITGEDHAHDAVHDHAHAEQNAGEKNDATK